MMENRRFVRTKPSGRVPRTAKIFADPKSPTIECFVVDVSAGGICLDVTGTGDIPKRFIVVHAGTRKTGRVVWRKGRRVGVAF